jgi:hypothetical protein
MDRVGAAVNRGSRAEARLRPGRAAPQELGEARLILRTRRQRNAISG